MERSVHDGEERCALGLDGCPRPPGTRAARHYDRHSGLDGSSHTGFTRRSAPMPSKRHSKHLGKNPHAVALGRLGGAKGGPARAKALSARRRREIAIQAATARALSMSAVERQALARRAAAARWSRQSIATADDAPRGVKHLFRRYRPSSLEWANPEHRYLIVREILVRGDDRAFEWLCRLMTPRQMRDFVRRYGGAGCNESEREKLRRTLRLSMRDIPPGPHGAAAFA